MYTDWLLIRRAAAELTARLRGAKVRDVGQLADGRFAVALWSRGQTQLLCVDAFAPTPVVTLEDGELPIAAEPGIVRTANAALRGTALAAVRSRRGDRLLRIEFAVRSRFGVESGAALVCELVPKFGNIVLLKDQTVVAAAKEFSPAENAVRSVQVGDFYEPPPLALEPTGTPEALVTAVASNAPVKQIARALRDARPLLPALVAESFVTQLLRMPLADPREAVERLIQHADLFVSAHLSEGAPLGDVFVYRDVGGALVQAHVVPLHQFDALRREGVSTLLPLFMEARVTHEHAQESDREQKRRREIARNLTTYERKLRGELERIDQRLAESDRRDVLRDEGDAIYATLYELDESAQLEAKERAAALFARYKKLGTAGEHLRARRDDVQASLESVDELTWELERAGADEIADVALAVSSLTASPGSKRVASGGRKRKPLQYRTRSGSRVLVGRSPIENADLTFRVARPDDLWFHVQNIPGAHVILQRDDRAVPPEEDVYAAASLAALYSKAKASPKVTVDYTVRKHVRKRPSAAPGLVFYTHPRTVYVEPGLSAALHPAEGGS